MIIGERVRLRAIERQDIPTFVRWFNDPEVRRHLTMFEPMSHAQEERWFERQLEQGDGFRFGVDAARDGSWVHIGSIGLHQVDWKNRSAVFGIALGEKDYWNQGYGTEAVRLTLRFAFDELNLHRVELGVFADNPRARRCYEKAGFLPEGTRREAMYRDGQYRDLAMMAVLEDDYRRMVGGDTRP